MPFLILLAWLYTNTDTVVLKVQWGCKCLLHLMIFDSKKSFRDSVFGEIVSSCVKVVHLFLYLITVAVDIHLHFSSFMLPQLGRCLLRFFLIMIFEKSCFMFR